MKDKQAPARLSGRAKFLVDFGPLLVFFIAYFFGRKIAGAIGRSVEEGGELFLAVAFFMPAYAFAFLYSIWKERRVAPMLLISGVAIGVLGALTLILHDKTFFYMKPTIVYAMFAVTLAGGLATGRNFLRTLFDGAFHEVDSSAIAFEIAARPPRRGSIEGDGIVSFGVCEVIDFRNPKCSAMIFRKEVNERSKVCTQCEHHLTLTPQERVELMLDAGSWTEMWTDLESVDALKFESESLSYKKKLSAAALGALEGYRWPGNVRELENVIERAVALCAGDELRADDLPSFERRSDAAPSASGPRLPESLPTLERRHIIETLERVGWNRRRAAALLQISTTTLWRRLKTFGIEGRGETVASFNHHSAS